MIEFADLLKLESFFLFLIRFCKGFIITKSWPSWASQLDNRPILKNEITAKHIIDTNDKAKNTIELVNWETAKNFEFSILWNSDLLTIRFWIRWTLSSNSSENISDFISLMMNMNEII